MVYTKCNVIGVVILYNSKSQVVSNIKSYSNQVNHVIVIDNSEIVNIELIEHIKGEVDITCILNATNLGIAHALNQAANIAVKGGYQFLLTMDDDTTFPADGVQKALDFINQYGIKQLGIVASQPNPKLFNNTVQIVPYTITSGSFLNLSAYEECGQFLDDLFIDFVDHEYCFRLKKYGYKVIEINYIHLKHNLGLRKQVEFINYKLPVYWTSHNPLRIYYKTRNCIFSLRKYNFLEIIIKLTFYKVIFEDFVKIVFFEDKKFTRLLLFAKGIYDGIVGNLGKRTFKI